MSVIGEHQRALARNLIETLGLDRALHVATQYGWYGVAEEIARERGTPGFALSN
jgi:hypothetical protein